MFQDFEEAENKLVMVASNLHAVFQVDGRTAENSSEAKIRGPRHRRIFFIFRETPFFHTFFLLSCPWAQNKHPLFGYRRQSFKGNARNSIILLVSQKELTKRK